MLKNIFDYCMQMGTRQPAEKCRWKMLYTNWIHIQIQFFKWCCCKHATSWSLKAQHINCSQRNLASGEKPGNPNRYKGIIPLLRITSRHSPVFLGNQLQQQQETKYVFRLMVWTIVSKQESVKMDLPKFFALCSMLGTRLYYPSFRYQWCNIEKSTQHHVAWTLESKMQCF